MKCTLSVVVVVVVLLALIQAVAPALSKSSTQHGASGCSMNTMGYRRRRHWGLPVFGLLFRGGSDEEEEQQEEEEVQVEGGKEHDNQQQQQQLYHFSLYQPGDGSKEDPDGIPLRFLNMQKGNRIAAQESLNATLEWRRQHNVDTILSRPHVYFDICKSITLHSFLGRDNSTTGDGGHVVFFQRPALNSHEHVALAHKYNLTNDDLILHYVYVLEYCWNILDPPSNATTTPRVMTSIIDLTGLNFNLLRQKELIGFVQQFVTMMSTHYPQRSHKTLILNAPSWFGLLYKLISPLLRESTKAKVQILSFGGKQVTLLRQVLGEDCLRYLPPELLVTEKKNYKQLLEANRYQPLPTSPMEQELRQFCCDRIKEAGLEMKSM